MSVNNQRTSLVAVTWVMTILGSIAVILRVITRGILIRSFGLDDLTICIGWIFTIAYAIEVLLAVWSFGLGYLTATVRLDQIIDILKDTVAVEVTYYGCVSFIKMSILFFYLRIAADYPLIVASRATIGFLAVFFVVSVIVVLGQCIPLKRSWDVTRTVAGSCISTTAFFYSTSAIHIALDLWIIVLPIKSLLRIQRTSREKIALVLIFGAGIFSMVSAIIRLYSIRIYTLSTDPVRDGILVNLWSILEVNVGIICASVPALKPLFSGNARRIPTTEPAGRHPYRDNRSSGVGGTGGARDGKAETESTTRLDDQSNDPSDTYNMEPFSTPERKPRGGGSDSGNGSLERGVEGTDKILAPNAPAYQAQI